MFNSKIAILPLFLLIGCASPSADKGDEELQLTDGKADSLHAPTERGRLTFGVQTGATVTDEELFHAWNFTLNDDAELSILTLSPDDFDTVLYVFAVDEEGETGRYIRRNDDFEGARTSGIEGVFSSGEYRVIAKGYAAAARGSFDVIATCEGAGCGGNIEVRTACGLTRTRDIGGLCSDTLVDMLGRDGVDHAVEVPLMVIRGAAVAANECELLTDIEASAVREYMIEWHAELAATVAAGENTLYVETREFANDSGVISVWSSDFALHGFRYTYENGDVVGGSSLENVPAVDLRCEFEPGTELCAGDVMALVADMANADAVESFHYDGDIDTLTNSPGPDLDLLTHILVNDFGNEPVDVEIQDVGRLFRFITILQAGARFTYATKPIDYRILMTFDDAGNTDMPCLEVEPQR